MKWLDLPPIWLSVCILLAWLTRTGEESRISDLIGWGLLGLASILVILAAVAFRRARTTIIPHQTPSAMITDGIFAITRNPIYLADVMVLAGLSLIWSSRVGLLMLIPLVLVLEYRFVRKEEARLRTAFGADFDTYAKRVRRWL